MNQLMIEKGARTFIVLLVFFAGVYCQQNNMVIAGMLILALGLGIDELFVRN